MFFFQAAKKVPVVKKKVHSVEEKNLLEEIQNLAGPSGITTASDKPSRDDRVVKSTQKPEDDLTMGITYDLLFGLTRSKEEMHDCLEQNSKSQKAEKVVPVLEKFVPPMKKETKSKEADEFSTVDYVKGELQLMRETLQAKITSLKEIREKEEEYLDALLKVRFK